MEAIILEGGQPYARQIEAIIDAGIPVMGHIGLLPQFSQNFKYKPDDWFIIQNTSSINTITETPYLILIGTDSGIYSHKKNTKDIFYDQMLTSDLSDKKIYFILYDENTDYYWVVHSLGISFKSSISTYWREKSFYSINLSFASDITGLVFNNEAIWIKEENNLISIDRPNIPRRP